MSVMLCHLMLYSVVGRISSVSNGAGSVPKGSLFDTQEDTQTPTHTDSGNAGNAALNLI